MMIICSDPKHVDWAKAMKAMYNDLGQFIKDHHASGLAWNPSGSPPGTGGPAAGGAPPPPPPPTVVPPSGPAPASKDTGVSSALFGQINKAGTDIATGLRKITDDMKTHKNPALRQSAVVSGKPKPAAKPAATKPVVAAKKPPVFENQGGKKWVVDYQENNRNLVIDGEMNQTIYMYQCKNSTLQVKGKVNSITLDGCKKCAVVFENVLSTCEFINCQSVQCQVTGKVPTISIDKTDGCQVFLSKDSLKANIVSAKSSEMNILVPNAAGDMVSGPGYFNIFCPNFSLALCMMMMLTMMLVMMLMMMTMILMMFILMMMMFIHIDDDVNDDDDIDDDDVHIDDDDVHIDDDDDIDDDDVHIDDDDVHIDDDDVYSY
ncbi:hypothetical protein QZH41_003575 [Actinostola sp. cb2023]|nr:hypothetical protein QZH41_003575 [Actinostola sp. cb2023]